MGDVGYLDDRGRLWFCGRKSHRVVTPHGTLFTDMVEPVFNTVPGVLRERRSSASNADGRDASRAVRGNRSHRGVRPFAPRRHRSSDDPALIAFMMCEAGRHFHHTRRITTFLHHHGFPVDVRHNSKIFREKLAVWADK